MAILQPNGGSNLASPLTRMGTYDTSSAEGLLALANSQGGSVAEVANELANPRTGILSTVGSTLKNAFSGFLDIISIPSNVIAGVMSSEYTVGEAMKENIRPSDVIFGEDESETTMQKAGSFLVRTAADILLDPLTYVTFGASAGVLGVRAATKIPIGANAAKFANLGEAAVGAVSPTGQNVYSLLRKVESQAKGLTRADQLSGSSILAKDISARTGLGLKESFDFTKKELQEVLDDTIDAPLDPEFAKRAMSRLLEKHPQLTETLLDKGGIKVFGQSILSGQRISSALKMVPGMTVLDHITQPLRQSVNGLFNTGYVKMDNGQWTRLPDDYQWLEQGAKDLAESMKDGRIRQLGNIIKANKLDRNEAKLLFASVEARKIPTDERLANAYRQLMGFNAEEFQALRKAGIAVSYRDKHVPHILVKGTAAMPAFRAGGVSEKVGATIQRKLEGTVFNEANGTLEALEGAVLSKDAEEMNKLLGSMRSEGFEIFDDNIVTALAARSVDNTKAIVTRNFLDSLGKHYARHADEAPDGWVALNLGSFKKEEEFLQKVGLAAETLRFHPAVAKRVEKFMGSVINDDASNDIMRAYDSVQNFWKAAVTSIFPAFHGRNAISNVFMHFMDIGMHALNPRTHAVSAQLVRADRKLNSLMVESMKVNPRAGIQDEIHDLMTKKVFTDATGGEWTFGELHRVIKNNNVAFNKNLTGPVDIQRPADSMADALFPASTKDIKKLARKALPVGQDFKGFEVGREVGRAIEEQARIVDFITNLKATGDVQLAAARTKQFLFDYQNLTAFEKTFLRRIMPFYTFTRKNLEMQVDTFIHAPGRTAAAITGITNLGDAMSGGQQLSDEELAALPEWIKSGINLVRKKEGSMVEIYGSLGTPMEAAFMAIRPNQILSSISPILRVPMELGSGQDFFRGKPLSESTNALAFKHAPQPIKELIGYTEVTGKTSDGKPYQLSMSLRPEMLHLVQNLPPSARVLSALRQMENENVETGSKIMQQLIGVKPYSFDLQKEAEKRDRELRKKLEDVLTAAGVTARFSKTYVPNPLSIEKVQ